MLCFGQRVALISLVFLRSGEITVPSLKSYDPGYHLSSGDVSQPTRTRVYVTIKASKTDPFRKGVTICLGRTDNDLCPVAAMSAYLVVRRKSEGASPFFQFSSGAPLTREMLVKRVREALGPSGVSVERYSGHSFRIGAATTAAEVGLEDSLIKTLGRWESSAYLLFVRVPREKLASVSVQLSVQVKSFWMLVCQSVPIKFIIIIIILFC